MKFRTYMYFDNRRNHIKFQGHRSKIKITGPDCPILYHYEKRPYC